jgi:hypothetical protein
MARGLFEHYGYRVVHQLLMTNALGILAFHSRANQEEQHEVEQRNCVGVAEHS